MRHPDQQAAPAPGEAQSTAWLAWLARGMQQHGQTIFLIEDLQPSWLSTRTQRWVYLLASRMFWGVIIGLIVGLIFGLIAGLTVELTFGLIVGLTVALTVALTVGLTVGIIDVLRAGRGQSQPDEAGAALGLRQIIRSVVLFVVIFGLIGGLGAGLIQGLTGGLIFTPYTALIARLIFTPFTALIAGLVAGPVWALRGFGRQLRNEIQTVESVRFSRSYLPRGFKNGLIVGLVFGLVGGLSHGLTVGLSSGLIVGLVFGLMGGLISGLSYGLIVGLIVGLLSCFRPGIRELKTIPNQGIRLSVRSGCLMGGVGGLALGLIVGLLVGPAWGLVYAMLGGLCIGLWYGGLDVIQHYIVRILLWRAGAMPRDYARFLDYAAEELNFLQKVGGGYIFVHRYLLEYFAAIEQPQPVAPADRQAAVQPAGDTV